MIDSTSDIPYNEIISFFNNKTNITTRRKTLYDHVVEYYAYEQQQRKT